MTVIVDKTTPTVVRVDPFNGQQGVPLGTNVTVIFSEKMDESTLNDNTVKLLKPGKKPASIPVTMTKSTDSSKTVLMLDPFGSSRQTLAASTASARRMRSGKVSEASVSRWGEGSLLAFDPAEGGAGVVDLSSITDAELVQVAGRSWIPRRKL